MKLEKKRLFDSLNRKWFALIETLLKKAMNVENISIQESVFLLV